MNKTMTNAGGKTMTNAGGGGDAGGAYGHLLYDQHNAGYNYHSRGVYHITLVVGGREKLLGKLIMDERHPAVEKSELGRLLEAQWQKTPGLQERHGNDIELLTQVVMPDHWHGVIRVNKYMSWSLGDIIQAVKASMTSKWRKMTGYVESKSLAEHIRNLTHEERRAFYPTLPREARPLFDDDYDDTICLHNSDGTYDERHLEAMVRYVDDNPRRAVMLRLHDDFFRRCRHIVIDGRDYGAFGNLYLLRWAKKKQVMCHRKARYAHLTAEERDKYGYNFAAAREVETSVPYIETEAFRREYGGWIQEVKDGVTVLVTPGISPGEVAVKNECLKNGYPMIHIQKEAITRYWKPELSRFAACERGSLLILAPWNPEEIGDVNGVSSDTDYSIFHNLNKVAAEVCAFHGTGVIKAW